MPNPSLLSKIRAASIAIVCLLFVVTAAAIWSDHRQIEKATYRDVNNLTDALAQQTRNNISAIDAALLTIAKSVEGERMQELTVVRPVFDILAAAAQGLPQIFHMIILGPDGRLLHTSQTPTPEFVDFSDLPAFIDVRGNPGGGLFVSSPVTGRVAAARDEWTIHISRRLVARDGSFSGVVAAAMSIEKMQADLEPIDVGPSGLIGLFRLDGINILRHPLRPERLGQSYAGGRLFQEFLTQGPKGSYEARFPSDGVTRIVGFQTLPDTGLLLLVGVDKADALAGWRTRSAFAGVLALFLTGASVGLLELVRRNVGRDQANDRARLATLRSVADASVELTAIDDVSLLMQRAAELARMLIPSHQAMLTLTIDERRTQAVRAVSLSDKYAEWRNDSEMPGGNALHQFVGTRNQPVRMTQAELERHPAWKDIAGGKKRHRPMRGWLAAPLINQAGQNIGLIQLSDRNEGDYSAEDEAILVQLANVTAICIENTQLIERSREAANTAQEARDRVATVLSSISDALYVLDNDFRFIYLNDRATRLLRRPREELLGKNFWEEFPAAADSVLYPEYHRAQASRENIDVEFHFPPFNTWFEVHVFPYEGGLSVYFRDITERIETAEKLRQSQKLEAIGQLTGGVAHDFNNLLTIILGNAELLAEQLHANTALLPLAEMTRNAAERAAELTQRLLAFARRQPLNPSQIDTNELVGSIENLLRRTLGEQIAIKLTRAPDLWKANVDSSQLENAILNLAINARDAMPGGGKLTIETVNADIGDDYPDTIEMQPGQYVMIAVTDTGHGIGKDILPRVVEPFFTTKDVGKGSGLGLSMVYGFVKQSGGHVKIYSEVGEGTTVKIYLPRATRSVVARAVSGDTVPPSSGRETVLLVEDDDMVRDHVKVQLLNLGYMVVEASDARSALDQFDRGTHVDLLLTDMIMPGGVSGGELAEQLCAKDPKLRVLFMSGYTEDAIVHHGRADRGVILLNKPFRKQELASKLRQALES